jgi:transcriptional regulator GlxA family with amidase domain
VLSFVRKASERRLILHACHFANYLAWFPAIYAYKPACQTTAEVQRKPHERSHSKTAARRDHRRAACADAREMRYASDFPGWLREQSTNVRRLGSVCTGALVLADADLLDGLRATSSVISRRCNDVLSESGNVHRTPKNCYLCITYVLATDPCDAQA